MPYAFTVADVVPAEPAEIYDAWLESRRHSAMTGAKAVASRRVGRDFSAWDGYITGTNVALAPGRRIVQRWRTSEFTEDDADSEIEVVLTAAAGGTRIVIHHRNVPDGQLGYERGGWQESYFDPMKEYFGRRRRGA